MYYIYIYLRKTYMELLYVNDHVINSYRQLRGQKGCYLDHLNTDRDSCDTGGCSWMNTANWFSCAGLNHFNSAADGMKQAGDELWKRCASHPVCICCVNSFLSAQCFCMKLKNCHVNVEMFIHKSTALKQSHCQRWTEYSDPLLQ